jgi:hypothetical protein
VYGMYPWDGTGAPAEPDAPARSRLARRPARPAAAVGLRAHVAALQFALDRRDNGGDATASPVRGGAAAPWKGSNGFND